VNRGSVSRSLVGYFQSNSAVYFFVIGVFVVGVLLGSLCVKVLAAEEKEELARYLEVFVRGLQSNQEVEAARIMEDSLHTHLRSAAFFWVLGVTLIGLPVIVALVFTRGFIIGFAVTFLVEKLGFRGVLFSLVSIWPHSILAVPAFIIVGAASLSFCWLVLTSRFFAKRKVLWWDEFAGYTALVLAMCGVLVGAAFVEGYITPVLMRVLAGQLL